jgi:hypothetical protein
MICSRLLGFYYSRFLESTAGVPPDIVGLLPIPKIDFDSAGGVNTIAAVEALSSNEDHAGEQMRRLDLVPRAQQGQVLHDYVSSTVSRLIANNRVVQLERRGFLEWLNVETGLDPLEMHGSSELRTYESLSFDDLLSILKRNRARIMVDPSDRSFQERLRAEHSASVSKIRPLKELNDKADKSVDRIVYWLYGLPTQDITLIESEP